MSALMNKLKYLKESIKILTDNILKLGIDVNGCTTREKCEAVAEIDIYQFPFDKITESGTDLLGNYELVSENPTEPDQIYSNMFANTGYFRAKPGVILRYYNFPYILTTNYDYERGIALDLSQAHISGGVVINYYVLSQAIRRLIMPEFSGYIDYLLPTVSNMKSGLYLSKGINGRNSPNWIGVSSNIEIPVKNPPDSNCPYYLNKITISAEDLVGIINNMIEVTPSTSKKITIGSTNLAKLTAEQIEIATQKGWSLA